MLRLLSMADSTSVTLFLVPPLSISDFWILINSLSKTFPQMLTPNSSLVNVWQMGHNSSLRTRPYLCTSKHPFANLAEPCYISQAQFSCTINLKVSIWELFELVYSTSHSTLQLQGLFLFLKSVMDSSGEIRSVLSWTSAMFTSFIIRSKEQWTSKWNTDPVEREKGSCCV